MLPIRPDITRGPDRGSRTGIPARPISLPSELCSGSSRSTDGQRSSTDIPSGGVPPSFRSWFSERKCSEQGQLITHTSVLPPFFVRVAWIGVYLWILLGVLATYDSIRRLIGLRAAVLGTIAAWLGTGAFGYTWKAPAMVHAITLPEPSHSCAFSLQPPQGISSLASSDSSGFGRTRTGHVFDTARQRHSILCCITGCAHGRHVRAVRQLGLLVPWRQLRRTMDCRPVLDLGVRTGAALRPSWQDVACSARSGGGFVLGIILVDLWPASRADQLGFESCSLTLTELARTVACRCIHHLLA